MLEKVGNIRSQIEELAPVVAARAGEIELERRIPPDLVDTLRSIGVFRLCVPRNRGGLEFDLPAALEVVSDLARIDGSIGWAAMIATGGSLFMSLLPRETCDRIFSNGPDVAVAGSIQPAGTAEPAGHSWRVSGRWPFASGCSHADWMAGFCVMLKNGSPVTGSDGTPQVRGFALPASDWTIEDTWHVAGLKGTGSHHITLQNALVPAEHFFDPEAAPSLAGPLYWSVRSTLPILHSAFAVGVARGALDDLIALANTGRQQMRAATPMRKSEVFQFELGRAAAELGAAEASHQVQCEGHWRSSLEGTVNKDALLLQTTQSAVWIAGACTRVVDACFTLGGGSVVYDHSPLQRRMRDIHVARQHQAVHQRHLVGVGQSLLKPDQAL